MAKHRTPAPRHRDAQASLGARARHASRVAVRNALVFSSLSAAATGTVVTGGVLLGDTAAAQTPTFSASAALPTPKATLKAVTQAAEAASRQDRRAATDPTKAAALAADGVVAEARTEDLSEADPQVIAQALMPEFGFSLADQWSCLDSLYISESDWQVDADNPTSTAYGIPQALTGLHDLPPGYLTSAEVQIRWGLDYIQDSYGTPCSAWAFKRENNWY